MGDMEVDLMTESYKLRESSGMAPVSGKFAGTISIEYSGLSHVQKQILEKRVMKCIEQSNQERSATPDSVTAPAAKAPKKKIFTKWQTNYMNAMPPGMIREEAIRIFRKRFKEATPSDTQIFNEYCRMKEMETDGVPESPDVVVPPAPPASPPVTKEPGVIPKFSVGDSVRYAKGNPAHPAKIGQVVEADKGVRMLVEFGPTDKKYVFKADYEKVEKA
jgi:hypothetical protein